MTHKSFISLCLTLMALFWAIAIQAQNVTVDGINYNLHQESMTADVASCDAKGDVVIPESIT